MLGLCALWGTVHSAAYYLTHTHTHTHTLTHSLTHTAVDYYLLLLFLSLLLSVCSCMRSFQQTTDNIPEPTQTTDRQLNLVNTDTHHTQTHTRTHNKPHIAHPHKQTACMLSCCLLRSSEAKLISFNLLFNYFIIYAPFRQFSAGSGPPPTLQGVGTANRYGNLQAPS